MTDKFTYVLTDTECQIIGIFETFELAKENVELLCTEYEFDKYYYTDEELLESKPSCNMSKVKLDIRLSLGNHSANPKDKCSGSWSYFTIIEYKLNELVEW
jgi:hypothetical protein